MIHRLTPQLPSPRIIRLVPLLAAACVAASAAAPTAGASVPCWKRLMNDWYSPPITNVYPIPCYHDAIKHLPTDVSVYSSARDDIERALQQAIAQQRRTKTTVTTIQPITTPTTPSTTSTGRTKTTVAANGGTTTTTPRTTTKDKKGPFGRAIRDITPGGADSFPLPLLILGLLAILLVLAGVGGLVWRRLQTNRAGP